MIRCRYAAVFANSKWTCLSLADTQYIYIHQCTVGICRLRMWYIFPMINALYSPFELWWQLSSRGHMHELFHRCWDNRLERLPISCPMAYGFILPSLPLRGKLHARFIHNQPTVEVHARRLDPFMSTERKARRPKGLRGMTSIATTVGAILALCPSKSEALTPPSLSPFGIEMQHTHISGIDGIHANRNLQLMRVVSKNTTKNATIPASTGAIETTGHTSIGQKLATVLRSRGFTKELVRNNFV